MPKFYIPPYKDRRVVAPSSYESHRQTGRTAIHGAGAFRASDFAASGLQVGDILVLGSAPAKTCPASFLVTVSADPNDFSFQLGLASPGGLAAIPGLEDFFCVIDPTAIDNANAATIPITANLKDPRELVRTNPNRRIQTFSESATAITGFDFFKSSEFVDFDIVLTILVLPIAFNFTMQFTWIFASRSDFKALKG